MRKLSTLAGLALAWLLAGCSPAASSATDETSIRAESVAAAVAEPTEEKLPPVTDAEGNELDPALAEAVRAKMDEDKAVSEAEVTAQSEDPADNSKANADDKT